MNKKADIMDSTLLKFILLGVTIIVLVAIMIMFNDAFRAKLLSIFRFF